MFLSLLKVCVARKFQRRSLCWIRCWLRCNYVDTWSPVHLFPFHIHYFLCAFVFNFHHLRLVRTDLKSKTSCCLLTLSALSWMSLWLCKSRAMSSAKMQSSSPDEDPMSVLLNDIQWLSSWSNRWPWGRELMRSHSLVLLQFSHWTIRSVIHSADCGCACLSRCWQLLMEIRMPLRFSRVRDGGWFQIPSKSIQSWCKVKTSTQETTPLLCVAQWSDLCILFHFWT